MRPHAPAAPGRRAQPASRAWAADSRTSGFVVLAWISLGAWLLFTRGIDPGPPLPPGLDVSASDRVSTPGGAR